MEMDKALAICSIAPEDLLEQAVLAENGDSTALREISTALAYIFNSHVSENKILPRHIYSLLPVFRWSALWKDICNDADYRTIRLTCAHEILAGFLTKKTDASLTDIKSNITLLHLLKDTNFDLVALDDLWWDAKCASYVSVPI